MKSDVVILIKNNGDIIMKKIANAKVAMALVAGVALTGCASPLDPTGDNLSGLAGGVAAAGAADLAGANEFGVALAAIAGVAGGQALNRALNGGCVRAGTARSGFRGGHVFYNPQLGFVHCPVTNITNSRVIDEFYADPNWQPVRQNRGTRQYSTFGVRGFR
jgi:hypothetical protein